MVRMHSPTVESTITKTYPDTQAGSQRLALEENEG
jgi:hypothetical protein